MTGEFDLIARYFQPLAGPEGLGLIDDAACFQPAAGLDIVLSKDLLVAGTHFFPGDDPFLLAQKCLAVNLSDLAAKGATPRFYLLGLALPRSVQSEWLAAFSEGMKAGQDRCGIKLIGGDTTATDGPLVVSITVIGEVPAGRMIRRSGAMPGDNIYVTGTLGEAALGLLLLQEGIDGYSSLIRRYHLPDPRMQVGQGLDGVATAAADISDGLLADLGHICRASGVGARIEEALVPRSVAAKKLLSERPDWSSAVWSGGDDYELVFTAHPSKQEAIWALSEEAAVRMTCIGHVLNGKNVSLVDQAGNLVHANTDGYQHFKS